MSTVIRVNVHHPQLTELSRLTSGAITVDLGDDEPFGTKVTLFLTDDELAGVIAELLAFQSNDSAAA